MTSNNQRRRKPRRRSSFPPPVIPAPHPSFLRALRTGIRPPPVGATLVVARSRANPFSSPYVAFARPPVIPACPDTGQESILPPRPPPVGATLVVARSRRQPVFIPYVAARPPVIPAEAGIHPPSPSPSRRGNPCGCPFPARTRFHPHMWPSQGHPSFLRRACPVPRHGAGIHPPSPSPSRRGNPCGCPFPAPTRFHPLMWPSQGHPSFLRRQESILPPRPPPVGATLVVARSRIPLLPTPTKSRRGNPCGCPFPAPSPYPSFPLRAPCGFLGGRNPSPPRPLR